jgi:hypothetical protein
MRLATGDSAGGVEMGGSVHFWSGLDRAGFGVVNRERAPVGKAPWDGLFETIFVREGTSERQNPWVAVEEVNKLSGQALDAALTYVPCIQPWRG